jgi:hypothetical protein
VQKARVKVMADCGVQFHVVFGKDKRDWSLFKQGCAVFEKGGKVGIAGHFDALPYWGKCAVNYASLQAGLVWVKC